MPIGINPHVFPLQDGLQTNQFIIPVYQRNYSWDKGHWDDLWNDLLYTKAKRESTSGGYGHFFGAICTISLPVVAFGGQNKYYLVDGQQRITTVVVLAKAIRDALLARGGFEQSLLDALMAIYAVNRDLNTLRIIPSRSDATAFREILSADPSNPQNASALFSAYKHLKQLFEEWLDHTPAEHRSDHVKALLRTLLEGFEIVQIALPNSDQCYEIFQSLNDRGTPLEEADKLRNLCFMNIAQRPGLTSEQSDAYVAGVHSPPNPTDNTNSWMQMEEATAETLRAFGKGGDLTDFMMRWGTLVGGDQFGREKTSSQLQIILNKRIEIRKQQTQNPEPRLISAEATEQFVREMSGFRYAYRVLRLPSVLPIDAAVLRAKIERVQRLGLGTACDALMLFLIRQWQTDRQCESAVIKCLNMLESYVVRRYLCRFSAKSDNRVFTTIAYSLYENGVAGDQIPQTLFLQLDQQQEINIWPDDQTLRKEAELSNVYSGHASMAKEVLMELERRVGTQFQTTDFEVEHVLPRKDLTEWWRSHLGQDAELIHRRYKNTIGNLVLLTGPENLSAGSHPLDTKKNIYQNVDRLLVREVSGFTTWREADIKARTKHLSDLAVQIWRRDMASL